MKNKTIKMLICIIMMSIFLIGLNYKEVNAAMYNIISGNAIIYMFNSDGKYTGYSRNIAEGQEINISEELEEKEIQSSKAKVYKINSNTIKTNGGTLEKKEGETWYIPQTYVAKSDSTLTSGEGTSVLIETNPNSGKGGGGISDFTDKSTLDEYKSTGVNGAGELRNKSNVIVGVLQGIGTVVAVIMLTVIGIKYMISSIEERAEFKETMLPYVIGAGSLLIISNLVGLIYSIMQGMM